MGSAVCLGNKKPRPLTLLLRSFLHPANGGQLASKVPHETCGVIKICLFCWRGALFVYCGKVSHKLNKKHGGQIAQKSITQNTHKPIRFRHFKCFYWHDYDSNRLFDILSCLLYSLCQWWENFFAVGAVWVVNFDRGARAGADGCSVLVTHFVVGKKYIVSHVGNICLYVL